MFSKCDPFSRVDICMVRKQWLVEMLPPQLAETKSVVPKWTGSHQCCSLPCTYSQTLESPVSLKNVLDETAKTINLITYPPVSISLSNILYDEN